MVELGLEYLEWLLELKKNERLDNMWWIGHLVEFA